MQTSGYGIICMDICRIGKCSDTYTLFVQYITMCYVLLISIIDLASIYIRAPLPMVSRHFKNATSNVGYAWPPKRAPRGRIPDVCYPGPDQVNVLQMPGTLRVWNIRGHRIPGPGSINKYYRHCGTKEWLDGRCQFYYNRHAYTRATIYMNMPWAY